MAVDHGPDNTVVVIAGGSGEPVTITVTNTFPAGKLVENGGAGPYAFTVVCTTDQGEVKLPPADSSFQLNDGEKREIIVPDGRPPTARRSPTPPPTAARTARSWSTGDATVDVTNTFEQNKPETPDEIDTISGGLPFTGAGSGLAVGLLGGVLAVTVGIGLMILRRRFT